MAMGRQFALCVALAAVLLALGGQGAAFGQDVYIGQMDGSQPAGRAAPSVEGASEGVYIDQLPSSARPATRPARVKQRAGAAQLGKKTARRVLPDVGPGVTLAVPAGSRDRSFPNVRKGTIGS